MSYQKEVNLAPIQFHPTILPNPYPIITLGKDFWANKTNTKF